MSCDNVITVQDLETDKKHSTFYREVITGKAGGTGADIDSATNAVTGQTQTTLPKVLSNVGFSPAGFDFSTGGTLTERDKAVFYQADGNWYSWGGAFPKVVHPASSPASTGGIADNAWNVSTSAFMYRDWEGFTAELLAQAGIVDDGLPDEIGASQRVEAIKIINGRPREASFLFEGNSITAGNTIGGYKYSDVFAGLSFATGRGAVRNTAVGGSYIGAGENNGNNISDRYLSDVYPHRPTANGGDGGRIAYLILLVGTNDLDTRFGNKSPLTVISQLTAYTQQAMNDGFTVVLQTILPRISNQNGWNIQTEKYRLTVNAAIRRGAIPCDIVADTESFVNDVTSTVMFHDGIHPTVLGSDMIAVYLNNVMIAGGSLELGNVIQGRNIQGLFESKDKTMIRVGSQYARTSLGTDYNENKNGFLIIENLNPTEPDSSLWMYETGVSADNKLKLLAVGDGLSGSVQAMAFARNGLRTWVEFGSVGQKTILGTPQSNNDSAPVYMQNMTASLGVNEKNWGWVTGGAGDARPTSLFLRTVSDDFTAQSTAVEFKRTGNSVTNVSFSCTIGTNGAVISPKPWALGSIKSGTGLAVTTTKYVEVEVGGTLVKLAVVNDPAIS